MSLDPKREGVGKVGGKAGLKRDRCSSLKLKFHKTGMAMGPYV